MSLSKMLLISAFAAMLATVTVAGTANGPTGVDVAKACYLLGAGFYFTHCVVDSRRGGVSIMVGFYFLFLVAVPAYVQIDRGIYPFYARYTVAQLATGLVVVALAHGALIAGQAMSGSVRRTGAMARTQPCNGNPASVRLSRNFAAVMLAASVLLAVYVGPETLFLNRSERGGLEQQGIDIQLLYIGRSTSLVALCVCVLMLRRAGSGQRVRGVVELSILAVPTFLVLNFPQGLSRFQLLGSALAIAVLCTSVFRTSRKAAFALGAPFFLFIFFPLIKAIGTGGEVDLSDAMSRDIGAYLLRVDFDSFKQIVDTTIYADTGPLRLGMNFLGALLFWVPRSLWQSKPVDSGEIVSTSLGYPFTNVSSPLPAEALISFGLVGVLVVFLLVGMAVSSIERSAMLVERVGGHELILYAITTGFVTIILRGALNGVAPIFGAGFVAYGGLAYLARRRCRSDGRGASGRSPRGVRAEPPIKPGAATQRDVAS
ncbi:hypothetical protein [Nocardioides aquaticus]|uniref:hypothetical protein n=1 Tax=Nocardioides aquaticus TaxID=160826 RepID=UPI0031DF15C0